MKIKLPKELRGVKFPRVCIIEMNDFDIDIFLPTLFFTILARGRGRMKITNDPTAIKKYVDALAERPALEGFASDEGKRVLERLVRTTLIMTSSVGRHHLNEQIVSIVPYSILSHKPGFPVTIRQRSADTFIYQVLRDCLGSDENLRTFVKTVFGRGITIGGELELGGTYDGTTKLDTMTRLSVEFLEGFQNVRPGIKREKNVPPSCPGLAREMSTDIWRYLFAYYSRMPIQALTYHLLLLLNFELFNYTLMLAYTLNDLVRHPEELPTAMHNEFSVASHRTYVDFTEESGLSREMAKASVRSDLETWQQFFYSNLLLRQLDSYVEKLRRNPHHKAIIEQYLQPGQSGAEYLQGLLLLQHAPSLQATIDALATIDEEKIYAEHNDEQAKEEDGYELNPEIAKQLAEITNTAESNIERVVQFLVEGQKKDGISKFVEWYRSVGGMKKTQGLLRGNAKSRHSWRYAPTNDLLAIWVQVAAARLSDKNGYDEQTKPIEPIRLQDFLRFLEEHYGILVDHPPALFAGAEYTAAAQDNLRAMLRRLRQMGIFRDLSDDFTVQRLHPPYAGIEIRMEH